MIYNENKFFLGSLCKRGHSYEGTGKSLRYIKKKNHDCVKCLTIIAKKWQLNDPQKFVQQVVNRTRQRLKTDYEFRLLHNLRARHHQALKTNPKYEKTLKSLGCSLKFFHSYVESLWKPGMSRQNYGFGPGKWVLDHVIACDNFDLTDPEQQRQCFYYNNFQPLWWEDNQEKGSK